MLVIGLTGGIGTGKTTVSDLFAELGVPVIDADLIARELTKPGQPAFLEITKHFPDIVLPNGKLNRKKLRTIIFNDPKERSWLEGLLHPVIEQKIYQRISAIFHPYCIVVVPLLLEVDSYPFIDRILVIDSPPDLQIKRVLDRDNAAIKTTKAIIDAQIEREQRLAQADDIIDNSGSLDELEQSVKNMHQFYWDLATSSGK